MKLKKVKYSHLEVQQLATEVDSALSRVAESTHVRVISPHNGKLRIPCSQAPSAIECLKVTQNGVGVLTGNGCVYTYEPSVGGCVVSAIDGLTVGLSPTYDFIFRLTYL